MICSIILTNVVAYIMILKHTFLWTHFRPAGDRPWRLVKGHWFELDSCECSIYGLLADFLTWWGVFFIVLPTVGVISRSIGKRIFAEMLMMRINDLLAFLFVQCSRTLSPIIFGLLVIISAALSNLIIFIKLNFNWVRVLAVVAGLRSKSFNVSSHFILLWVIDCSFRFFLLVSIKYKSFLVKYREKVW